MEPPCLGADIAAKAFVQDTAAEPLGFQPDFHTAGAYPGRKVHGPYPGVDVGIGPAGIDHRRVTVAAQLFYGLRRGVGNDLGVVVHKGAVNVEENYHLFLGSSLYGYASALA